MRALVLCMMTHRVHARDAQRMPSPSAARRGTRDARPQWLRCSALARRICASSDTASQRLRIVLRRVQTAKKPETRARRIVQVIGARAAAGSVSLRQHNMQRELCQVPGSLNFDVADQRGV